MKRLVVALLAGALTAATPPALAQVVINNPPPATTSTVATSHATSTYHGLVWGGLTMFGLSYGTAVIAGAVANDVCAANNCDYSLGRRDWLYVPLVGPFVAMDQIEGTGGGRATARALLAIDGVLQIGGVAMFVTGILLSARPQTSTVIARRGVQIMPYGNAGSTGLAAVGRF